jgi:cobalamin synthase
LSKPEFVTWWYRLDVESGRWIPTRTFSSTERGESNMRNARGTWFYPVVGAVIGLLLGIVVSVTTDVPLAPEAGLVLGALLGWLSRRVRTSRTVT